MPEVVLRISAEDKAKKIILQVADQFKTLGQQVEATGTSGTKTMTQMTQSGRSMLSNLGGSFMKLISIGGNLGMMATGLGTAFNMVWGTIRTGIGMVTDLTRRMAGLGKSILFSTLHMEKYQLQMKGALGTHRIAKRIVGWAMEYAKKAPTTFEAIMEALTGFARISGIKPMLMDMENLNENLSGLMQIAVGLQAIDPMQGMMGALFALREALTGNMRSLRMRFEIMPAAIAATIGKSVDVIKKSPELFLKAMRKYVLEEVGEKTMFELSQMLDVQADNIFDSLKQIATNIGESGFLQAVTSTVMAVANATAELQQRMMRLGTAKRIGEALTATWKAMVNAAKGATEWVVEKFLGRSVDLSKDLSIAVTEIAEVFSDKIPKALEATLSWLRDNKSEFEDILSLMKKIAGVPIGIGRWSAARKQEITEYYGGFMAAVGGGRGAWEQYKTMRGEGVGGRGVGYQEELAGRTGQAEMQMIETRTASTRVQEELNQAVYEYRVRLIRVKEQLDDLTEATVRTSNAKKAFISKLDLLQKKFKETIGEVTGLDLEWLELTTLYEKERTDLLKSRDVALQTVINTTNSLVKADDEAVQAAVRAVYAAEGELNFMQLRYDMMERLRNKEVETSADRLKIMDDTIAKLHQLATSNESVRETAEELLKTMTAGAEKLRDSISDASDQMREAAQGSEEMYGMMESAMDPARFQSGWEKLWVTIQGGIEGLKAGMYDFVNTSKNSFNMFREFGLATFQDLSRSMSKMLIENWRGNLDNAAQAWSDFVDRLEARLLDMLVEKGLQALVGWIFGFQQGGIVPRTGLYALHQGEQVVPTHARGAEKGSQGSIQVINVVDPSFVNQAIADDPNMVINVIGADILRNGPTRSTMRARL